MKQRYKNLTSIFILVAAQLSLLNYAHSNAQSLELLAYAILALLLASTLLTNRLKKDKHGDYFPNFADLKAREVTPSILILGKEFTPEGHENDKDDRYLRVSLRWYKSSAWLGVMFYILTLLLVFYFFTPPSLGIYPISFFIGLSLLTRSHGQLLFLPTLGLIYVFFRLDWLALSASEQATLCFTLIWLTFTAFKMIHSLRLKEPEEFNEIKGDAIPLCSLVTILFMAFIQFVPLKEGPVGPTPKDQVGTLQKINGSLGRIRISKVEARYNQNLMNLAANIKNSKLSAQKLDSFLDQMDDRFNDLQKALQELPQMSLTIGEGQRNYLKNTNTSLNKEMRALKEELRNTKETGREVSQEQIDKILALTQKIDQHSKSLEKLNIRKKQASQSLEESFQNALGASFKNDLQEEIQNLADPGFEKALKEKSPELFSQVIQKAKSKEAYQAQKQQTAKAIEAQIAAQLQKKNLIAPEKLDHFIKGAKALIIFIIVLICLRKLKELFDQDDEQGSDEALSKKEKRELLLKKKYATSSEEIRALFLQFIKAAQKVHYPHDQEHLPPPKILNAELLDQFSHSHKSLTYFLEVFSLSEYRNQLISASQLAKYRKAYRRLIRGL